MFFELANPGQIRFYADCNIDDVPDGVLNNMDFFTYIPGSTYCAGTDGLISVIGLDPGISIISIKSFDIPGGTYTTETKGSIEFLRPEPSVWIAGSTGSVLGFGGLEVRIADQENNTKKIIMWMSGNIEVQ